MPGWSVALGSALSVVVLVTVGMAVGGLQASPGWLVAVALVAGLGVGATVAWTVGLEHRRRAGARLARLGLAVAKGMQGQDALEAVLESVRQLLRVDVVVLTDVAGAVEPVAQSPQSAPAVVPAEAPPRAAARTRRPLVIAPCPPAEVGRAWGTAPGPAPVASVAWIPIVSGDHVLGVIGAASAERRRLSEDQAPVFDAVGELVGACLRGRELLAGLEVRATLDGLTGVLNRTAVDRQLEVMIAGAARASHPLCIAMVDLDHFKTFNDDHGHLAGDRALKEVAAALQAGVRRNDLVGRFGGEEFIVVFDGVGLVDALAALSRVRSLLPPGVTASAGLAQWRPAETRECLVRRADQALYRAKRDGRDRVTLAD